MSIVHTVQNKKTNTENRPLINNTEKMLDRRPMMNNHDLETARSEISREESGKTSVSQEHNVTHQTKTGEAQNKPAYYINKQHKKLSNR